jgi:hypothetical protein
MIASNLQEEPKFACTLGSMTQGNSFRDPAQQQPHPKQDRET